MQEVHMYLSFPSTILSMQLHSVGQELARLSFSGGVVAYRWEVRS